MRSLRTSLLLPLLCLAAAAVTACRNPRAVVLPNNVEDIKSGAVATAIKQLSAEDQGLLAAYMLRTTMGTAFGGAPMPSGTTIGQAIDAQKAWVAQQKQEEAQQAALAAKAKRERAAAFARLRDAVTVALVHKGFQPADIEDGQFQAKIAITLAFQNKTAKPVLGIKGTAIFSDIFGDVIQRLNVAYDHTIPAGASQTWDGAADYNEFDSDDVKLRQTPMEKLHFTFEPSMVLFADGTKLALPSDDADE